MSKLQYILLKTNQFSPEENLRFSDEAKSVSHAFLKKIGAVSGFKQITCVVGSDEQNSDGIIDAIGVGLCSMNCDIGGYFSLLAIEKKIFLINLLAGLNDVCGTDLVWPESLKSSVQELLKSVSEGPIYIKSRKKASPGKSKTAQVDYRHDLESFSLYMNIVDGEKSSLFCSEIVNTSPDELVFSKYLGLLEWENDELFLLRDRFGDIFFKWSESTGGQLVDNVIDWSQYES